MHSLPLVDRESLLSFILHPVFLITEAQNSNLWPSERRWLLKPEQQCSIPKTYVKVREQTAQSCPHVPIINNKKQVKKKKYNQPHKHLRDREPTYILWCLERRTLYPDNQWRMPVCLPALWVFAISSGGFSHFAESCSVAVRPFGSRFTMLQVKQPEIRAGKPQVEANLGSEMY